MQIPLPSPPKALPFFVAILYSLLSFSLAFSQAPTITTLSPIRNAISAPRTSNVSVTFSQAMNAATASNAAIQIRGSQTGTRTLAGKGTFSGGGTNTVTFDPTTDFKSGEQVQVSITTNAQSNADKSLIKPQVFNFTAASAIATATFSRGQDVTGGGSGDAICSADFNGDGYVDIAISHFGGEISIYLNDGTGHFSSTPIQAYGNLYAIHLCAADFDNDGDIDIASASSKYSSLSVIFNDGTAHFDQAVGVDMTPGPGDPNYPPTEYYYGTRYLTAGDLDGDGDVDMAVASAGIAILTNDGTGHFTKYFTSYYAYNYIHDEGDINVLSLGDVDNDDEPRKPG